MLNPCYLLMMLFGVLTTVSQPLYCCRNGLGADFTAIVSWFYVRDRYWRQYEIPTPQPRYA